MYSDMIAEKSYIYLSLLTVATTSLLLTGEFALLILSALSLFFYTGIILC